MNGAFIPPVRLDNAEVWDALAPRIEDLVKRGGFVLGPELEEFEAAAAAAFGCRWAAGVSSGTSALWLALRALGLQPGARVALPANTFFATCEAVLTAGMTPVIVDNDDDYLIDLDALGDAEVDAVIPVHLYGLPVDMERVAELADGNGWKVLEDCSQAHGATVAGRPVGSIGDAGAFSAYPTKNLGAWGDAGFVTGSDDAVGATVRSLRHHGQRQPNVHSEVGSTERLDNLQALVLTEKLRRLPDEIAARRRVAQWYREALDGTGLDLPGDRGNRTHVYHQFVVRIPRRDEVREQLRDLGIGTGVHYPAPVHLQPAVAEVCEVAQRPRRAEAWAGELLSLPFFPSLSQGEVERVAEALRKVL
ncbi:MAG: DegT/DnrJ/EryC1/StrS family aminotransferase [Actinomycetota bacterium]|nr:DegT/DnrJ/EryC1/StrS family aminotransferase [Actinomycetota bacterium]